MSKPGIHILLLLLFQVFTYKTIEAQTLGWKDVFYGTINDSIRGRIPGGGDMTDMKVDNEGNLVVSGGYFYCDSLNGKAFPKPNNIHQPIAFLAKFDTAGRLLWIDTTSGGGILHIEISDKGDYFFSGRGDPLNKIFPSPNPPTNNSTGFMGKCDRNGKIYWVRKYIDYHFKSGMTADQGITNFKVDSSENVYFIETMPDTPDYMIIDNVKYQDSIYHGPFIAKFDSAGNLAWLNPGNQRDQVAIDRLGNTYCFANYDKINSGGNPSRSVNKYNTAGKLVRSFIFDKDSTNQMLNYIATDKFNNIYIGVTSDKGFTLNGKFYPDSLGNYLIKFDTNFNIQWSLFTGNYNAFSNSRTISINDKTGYLYLFGNYSYTLTVGGQSTHNALADSLGNLFFAKIDLNGNVLWIKNTIYSPIGIDYPPMIIEDACNNFLVIINNVTRLHFNGLNVTAPDLYETVMAKFSSDSLGFVNQNTACSLSFKNISKPVYSQFKWYAKDTADTTIGKLIATTKDLNYRFPHKGKYIITLLAIKPGGCTNTTQDTFNVPGLPISGFNAIDTQGCQYVQFLFSDTSHADTISAAVGQSWRWDFGDGSPPLSYTQTKRPVVSHVYTQSGTYTVTLVYGNGLCTDTFTSQKRVVIIPAPKPGFAVSDTLGCVPLSVNVTDGSVGAVVNWVYTTRQIQPLPPPAGDTALSPSFSETFNSPGLYVIHQYLTGTTGCVTEDSVMVDVTPVFLNTDLTDVADVTVDTSNYVEVKWLPYSGALSYNLYRYTDNDTSTSVSLAQTTNLTYEDNSVDASKHSYAYYIQAQDGCGHFTSHGRIGKTIRLSGFENGDLLPQLTWSSYKDWAGGVSSYQILRQDPGGPFKHIGTSNKDTIYTDTALIASDAFGECYRVRAISNDTVSVSFSNNFCFSSSPKIFIPNIFTPNGDTLNDRFAPVCMGIKNYSMVILNRWGEKVYKASPQPSPEGEGAGGWDGSFKGAVSPNGIYVYYIKAEDFNGNTITRKGMVMLQQ